MRVGCQVKLTEETVTHGGVGMGLSRNDAGKDTSQRSSHIVGRPHKVPIEQAGHQAQILLLAIKIAAIY